MNQVPLLSRSYGRFPSFRGVLPHLSKARTSLVASPSVRHHHPGGAGQAAVQAVQYHQDHLGAVDGRYEEAARLLDSWLSSSKLVQDKEDCYYLYRQGFKDGDRWLARTGIIGILRSEG